MARASAALRAGDAAEAEAIYRKLGVPVAIQALGLMRLAGVGGQPDPEVACDLFQKAADAKLASAARLLGDCYYSGHGRPQDYAQSLAWYTKAADRGDGLASCALGDQYTAGLGVSKDPDKGLALCTFAAEDGDPEVQTEAGQRLLATQDFDGARRLLTKAADHGQANAQFALGRMFWTGTGAPEDPEQAHKWLDRAARAGHPAAPLLLGQYYLEKSVDLKNKQVDLALAVPAAYWLGVAAKVDPDPAMRVQAGQFRDHLLDVVPDAKPKVAALVASGKLPDR